MSRCRGPRLQRVETALSEAPRWRPSARDRRENLTACRPWARTKVLPGHFEPIAHGAWLRALPESATFGRQSPSLSILISRCRWVEKVLLINESLRFELSEKRKIGGTANTAPVEDDSNVQDEVALDQRSHAMHS